MVVLESPGPSSTARYRLGRRDAATFRRLYDRLKGAGRVYFTDDWPAYSAVLPAAQHVIGKTDTHTIGRNNANRRHYMARMTRRGKNYFQKSHHG